MNTVCILLAFLGPGLFGALMGRAAFGPTSAEAMMLMLVPPGLAWVVFGLLCMQVNQWSWGTTFRVCLAAMAPGSALLGLASTGFLLGGGAGWAVSGVLVSHFVMMGRFVRLGRRTGRSTARLAMLWLVGLDGMAIFILGVLVWA